jgi:hypothetical protein
MLETFYGHTTKRTMATELTKKQRQAEEGAVVGVGDVVSIPMKLFRKEQSLVLGCFSVFF